MQQGIWQYEEIAKDIKPEFRLSLDEGNTPVEEVETDCGKIFIKREDKNPNKSFKDRSLAYQLSHYHQKGDRNFIISSSGNAAASALAYSALFDSQLKVFVSENIPEYKYQELMQRSKSDDQIIKSKKPKSDAFKLAKEAGAVYLRGSTDDNAIPGYHSLAYELSDDDFDAIFICCSSGTSTLGIYRGFKHSLSTGKIRKIPQIHVVQTSNINPIANEFDKNFEPSENSLANAVSDRVAHRKPEIMEVIRQTGGSGWVVSDAQLQSIKEAFTQKGVEVEGFNAYMGLTGFVKAVNSGLKFEKPLILISGI